MSSKREQFAAEELLHEFGVEWFSLNRPGYGETHCVARHGFSDWAERVDRWAEEAGVRDFHLVGFSGGGPYALACAFYLAGRVRSLTLIGSLAPFGPELCAHRPPWGNLGGAVLRNWPAAGERIFKGVDQLRRWRPIEFERWHARASSPPDRAVLSRPETIRMMQEAHAEAFHQGAGHIVQDLHLSARTWNFEVEAIRCRTTIHVGADDSQVPPAAGKWLATQIPNARLREYPRQGHYVHYAAAREILQGIVIP